MSNIHLLMREIVSKKNDLLYLRAESYSVFKKIEGIVKKYFPECDKQDIPQHLLKKYETEMSYHSVSKLVLFDILNLSLVFKANLNAPESFITKSKYTSELKKIEKKSQALKESISQVSVQTHSVIASRLLKEARHKAFSHDQEVSITNSWLELIQLLFQGELPNDTKKTRENLLVRLLIDSSTEIHNSLSSLCEESDEKIALPFVKGSHGLSYNYVYSLFVFWNFVKKNPPKISADSTFTFLISDLYELVEYKNINTAGLTSSIKETVGRIAKSEKISPTTFDINKELQRNIAPLSVN